MSKRSRKPSMKVVENLEMEELRWVEAVLYIVLMLHPELKIMPFKLTGYCRMRSKDGKFKPRRRMQNVWLYRAKMDSSQQRQMRLQDISAHKTICSQLETLEKRVINL